MEKIKRLFKYLTREELEIQHRLMNGILVAGAGALGFCLIFDLIIGTGTRTYWIIGLLIVSFITSLYLANVANKPNAAGILLSLTSNYILMPILYFKEGGKESGMPLWLMLSALFVWLIVKKWPCFVLYVGNMIIYATLLLYEYYHPESVIHMDSRHAEYVDYIFGICAVVLIFGIIFKFQNRTYEKKRAQLEAKEQELTDLNEQLIKANEAKSIFLASMSHEIRTPINAIVGMNEMILRESGEKQITSYASDIEAASGTLLSLVNDILDFSKIESGLMDIIPDEYELSSLLCDCYNLLEIRAADKGLELSLRNDPKIPNKLCGDEIRIRQILTNILTNAVKYTDTGSIKVDVNMRGLEDDESGKKRICLIMSVTDTGRGMSEESLDSIFDSFTRVDEKENKHIEGTGLGLSITKQLVDLMGGKIEVHSAPGKGSTFTVFIPQDVVSDEPMGDFKARYESNHKASSEYHESFRAPDASILVVDDVPVNLHVISMLLKQTQVKVTTATSGKECLDLYEKNHYDMVFLDHMMPEMDGIETVHRLKEMNRYKEEATPVIALTANAIMGAEKIYLDTGFDDYLTKPVKSADLEAMICKYLTERGIITH